jgi:serine/threonine protein phosphatase PrpC
MIRIEQSHLSVTALTHPGMTGKNNEDRFAVSAYQIQARRPERALLAILADGIGGHRAGEVAAEMAVNQVSRLIAASDATRPVETLRSAIQAASHEILIQAQNDPARQGMGATCACAWILADRLYTASVGDSRLYLVRDGAIQRLSTDHTWIQEALEKGLLRPEQTRGHPNAHVIRRYLGSPQPPEVDFRLRLHPNESDVQASANQGVRLHEGDRLLLCSDGLTDLVQDDEILAILEEQPQETACQTLIALANERGGHDNITLISIQVPAGALRPPGPPRLRFVLLLAILVMLAILAAALLLSEDLLGALPPAKTNSPPGATQPVPVIPPPATPASSETAPAGPTRISPSATPRATSVPKGLPTAREATLTPWPTLIPYP